MKRVHFMLRSGRLRLVKKKRLNEDKSLPERVDHRSYADFIQLYIEHLNRNQHSLHREKDGIMQLYKSNFNS